jgi:hypothetical protein
MRDIMEDVAKIILAETNLDYFDLKALRACNKGLMNLVNKEARYHVDQSGAHRIYACVYGHLVNLLPKRAANKMCTMGVKITFRGGDKYTYQGQFNNPILREVLVAGMAWRQGEEMRFYFGNCTEYFCVRPSELTQIRGKLRSMIWEATKNTQQYDIQYCNVDNALCDFLSQFVRIVTDHTAVASVNLAVENMIAENELIFHS